MPESPEQKQTVHVTPDALTGQGQTPITDRSSFFLRFLYEEDGIPPYWSRARDTWLRAFVLRPGNDLLAGTVSTITAKVASTNWYIEGPERTANLYRQLFLTKSNFYGGWSRYIQAWCWDYLTQDQGGWSERIRQHSGYALDAAAGYQVARRLNTKGGALGFANLDNGRMLVNGDPNYPGVYTPTAGQHQILLHRSQLIRIVDNPSPQETLYQVGYCAVSRAITTARILMDIATYERERLSDLPPTGILTINNMSRTQWEDIEKQYNLRQSQQGNKVWRDLLVAVGLSPELPVSIEMVSFSQLPEHFDKKTATEIAVYSFALAFRIDPREIWPVSSASLGGTATEANIMHVKARAKGAGLILTDIERAFNDGLSLPPSLKFHFDFQDTDEDRQAAEIALLKADFITRLTKPDQASGQSLVSVEEGREWLVREGLFEDRDLITVQDETRADDMAEAKSRVDMGAVSRVYRDGRVVRLERKRRLWPVVRASVEGDDGKLHPAGKPLPEWPEGKIVPITAEDVARANRAWDREMPPEFKGLLNAEPV